MSEDTVKEEASKSTSPEVVSNVVEPVKAKEEVVEATSQEVIPGVAEPAKVKEDVDEATSQEVISNVAERLRFFFSDANLRVDAFLRREVLQNQLVPIEILLRFNTIKKYTLNPDILVKAVKQHKEIEKILQLSKDEAAIGRRLPFTEDMMKDNIKLTLRVSNIPTTSSEDNEVYSVTREELKALFEEFGSVAMVRLLHNNSNQKNNGKKRVAIGRAFVEFESADCMQRAAAELCLPQGEVTVGHEEEAKAKRMLKLGDNELRVKTMQQWLDKREGKRNGVKGKRRDKKGGNKRPLNDEQEAKDAAALEAIEFKLDWKKGCVISVKGLSKSCEREKILKVVQDFVGLDVPVRADYSRGQEDGAIRFEEPNDNIAKFATKLNDGSILVDGCKVQSAVIIEGAEEEKYYKTYIDFRTKQKRLKEEDRQRKRTKRFR